MQTTILAVILMSWLLISEAAAAGPVHRAQCPKGCIAFRDGYDSADINSITSKSDCDGMDCLIHGR